MARRQRTERLLMPSGDSAIRTVRRGETAVAYQVIGDSGSMALLLQPFWVGMEDVRSDPNTFGPQLAGEHRVIVHDRRGTGASDRHPGQVSVRVQAEDLVAILDDVGVNRVLVVAMTEAAPLAVYLAAQHPGRVARVALIDPHLRPRVGPGSTMLLHTLHSRPRVGLKAFARSLVADDESADVLTQKMVARMDAPTAARLYEAFLQADALDLAGTVEARTLLAFGVHDKLVLEEEAHELQRRFPNGQVGIVEGTPGTAQAMREAWVQTREFLSLPGAPEASSDPEPPRRVTAPIAAPRAGGPTTQVGDYVPVGAPPRPRPLSATLSPHSLQQPVYVRWGPPPQIPKEAVELNRKAVDHILLGEIEEALAVFQKAIEMAPDYEDAAINYRELLSRLVQRRVAQWQTEQAEMMMKEAERQASRYAKRSRRFGFGRLFKSGVPAT
jgi:pimeloyl-ACP methyl ester carboxylesterase